jgi:16S rRNA (cytosine967-C5)-methyltransferase
LLAIERLIPGYSLQPFPHRLEDTTTGGTLTIRPHLHDCDGRFIARMIRTTSTADV